MNLLLAHALLQAAKEESPGASLRVHGVHIAREVGFMREAGLVEGSVGAADDGEPVAEISAVTDLGHKFVRTLMGVPLRGSPLPEAES